MKTPRKILLERHQAAAPKLDTLRHAVVEKLNNKATKEQSLFGIFISLFSCSKNFWRELIFPSRRIWSGLATIWIFIFIVNFSMRDHSQMTMVKSSPTPEMVLAYRQQEKLLNELIGPAETQPAESPKVFTPRPSSRRQFEILAA